VHSPHRRFSRRLSFDPPPTRLAAAVAGRAARGEETLDLTETNPTRVGLPYPEAELGEILARGAAAPYRPDPRGLLSARQALAAALSRPGDAVSPDDLLLTASTSEAYGFLFKLLLDPGEEVLAPIPSYPLLDELAALEGVRLGHFPLEPGRRFALDAGALERAAGPATRALVVVHPNNPTGGYLTPSEQDAAAAVCAARGLALVSDEVFGDYPLSDAPRAGPAAARGDVLAFSLGGLSKSAGLPSWKLGWMRVGGPPELRRRTLDALEHVADSYLSVATPVQRALPGVLALLPRLQAMIRDRLLGNLRTLREALSRVENAELLLPQGGWSAVLRVSHTLPDEDLALRLLEREGVLAHPGYFFDFASEDFLVLSLLPEPGRFGEGVRRLAGLLQAFTVLPL